jgi:hypothetical protein
MPEAHFLAHMEFHRITSSAASPSLVEANLHFNTRLLWVFLL